MLNSNKTGLYLIVLMTAAMLISGCGGEEKVQNDRFHIGDHSAYNIVNNLSSAALNLAEAYPTRNAIDTYQNVAVYTLRYKELTSTNEKADVRVEFICREILWMIDHYFDSEHSERSRAMDENVKGLESVVFRIQMRYLKDPDNQMRMWKQLYREGYVQTYLEMYYPLLGNNSRRNIIYRELEEKADLLETVKNSTKFIQWLNAFDENREELRQELDEGEKALIKQMEDDAIMAEFPHYDQRYSNFDFELSYYASPHNW